jgi:pilus assembly protein Flp/PilA
VGKVSEMNALVSHVRSFLTSEDGPTATEYAVMLALIVLVSLTAITALGGKVNAVFTDIDSRLSAGSAS